MTLKHNKTFLWTFDQHLVPRDERTEVAADGLHYARKAPGSPFASANGFSPTTMSCFLCGRHRPRSQMKIRKLAGKSHGVCAPHCAAGQPTPDTPR